MNHPARQYQYVKVDLGGRRAYTYRWAQQPPLRVGEWVIVPPNELRPTQTSRGQVLRILPNPDYDGFIKAIVSRAPKDAHEVKRATPKELE